MPRRSKGTGTARGIIPNHIANTPALPKPEKVGGRNVLQKRISPETRRLVFETFQRTGDAKRVAEELGLTKRLVRGVLSGWRPPEYRILEVNVQRGLAGLIKERGMTRRDLTRRVAEEIKAGVIEANKLEGYDRTLRLKQAIKDSAEKWGLPLNIVQMFRRDEMYRLRSEEFLTQNEIAEIFGVNQSRVMQILEKYPEVDSRLLKLSKFMKQVNPRFRHPQTMLDYMEKYCHKPVKELARKLEIDEIEVTKILQILEMEEEAARRKEERREKITRRLNKMRERKS